MPRLPGWVTPTRRRAETVIGQLVERYHAKRVWARTVWHLWSRWQRKLLSHTLAVYLCQQHGLGPLRFADLTSAKPAHRVSLAAPERPSCFFGPGWLQKPLPRPARVSEAQG